MTRILDGMWTPPRTKIGDYLADGLSSARVAMASIGFLAIKWKSVFCVYSAFRFFSARQMYKTLYHSNHSSNEVDISLARLVVAKEKILCNSSGVNWC